ncbi:hypothetical protein [Sorangium sp. So ce1151]|uniref:hypothetical protein n=1 Tax=Sorangium sp. So ce1151 TaxID=3133332 RepID=UPI003F5E737D
MNEEPEKERKLDLALRKALDWALSLDRAKAVAHVAELQRKYPNESKRQLADRIISRSRWWGAGAGFVTGLPANPWVAVPAAVTDVATVLSVEVQVASRIALLFDSQYFNDQEPPYELLIPIMGGRAAAEFMRELTIRGGMGVSRQAIKKALTKETLKQFKRIMLKYFGLKVGQRSLIAKTLPVVGGVIGGAWNYNELKVVGNRVYEYFEGREIGAAE